jgi:hypothetical protein
MGEHRLLAAGDGKWIGRYQVLHNLTEDAEHGLFA